MNIVYHGSSNGSIREFIPHESTHQKKCIYATPNKVVALLFMSHGNGDLDTKLSYEDNKPILIERREGVLNSRYNTDGYLYELDGSTFSHYNYLWGAEVISFASGIKPLKKTYYENILSALDEEEKNGNIIIYRYPKRPDDMPLDNSDLIEKYIRFEEMGHKGSLDKLLMIYPDLKKQVFARLNNPTELYFVDNENDSFGKVIAFDNIIDAIEKSKTTAGNYGDHNDGVFVRDAGSIDYYIDNGKFIFSKGYFNTNSVFYIYKIKGDIKRISAHSFEVDKVEVILKEVINFDDYMIENNGRKYF